MNNITINLAKKLIAEGNEITFIDDDKSKSEKIENEIGFVSLLGTSTSKSTLIEAGLERADYFVASNIEDDINFLSIKIAKSLNNDITTVALINKTSNKKYFAGDDFDFALEYDEMISETLNSFISNNFDQLIFTNTDNHTEIRVISVGNDSSLVGKTINDIDFPFQQKFLPLYLLVQQFSLLE